MTRPDWDSYFLGICEAVSKRADCRRRLVGACIVNPDHIIIGTGYNGTRAGEPGCLSGACPRGLLSYEQQPGLQDYSSCIASHAEVNAALHTTQQIQGCTVYVNHEPCSDCQKFLKNAGLAAVIWPEGSIAWN